MSTSSWPVLTGEEPSRGVRTLSWQLSPALFGAVTVGGLGLFAAVVFRRPDVVVLALPFLLYAGWAGWTRPEPIPGPQVRLGTRTLFEGQATTITVTVDGDRLPGGIVTAMLPATPWLDYRPGSGLSRAVEPAPSELVIEVRPQRWGTVELTGVHVAVMSSLAAWRAPMIETAGTRLKVLPLREAFEAVNVMPRPAGLVGGHTARRPGDAGELSGVRPFVPGDRLRRINWRVSSRRPELHVNDTWSERDTEVQLWLDSREDLGRSGGVDGPSSSLDLAVRAAAALAEHYLRQGDRVSLVDLGAGGRTIPAGSGRAHLRRVLDGLVTVVASRSELARRSALRPGALVVVLSPLLDPVVLDRLAAVVQQGSSAVVIDTLPDGLTDPAAHGDAAGGDPAAAALAWRMRLGERAPTVTALAQLGVPVVGWRGPGSLDEVLRDISRMAGAPRIRS